MSNTSNLGVTPSMVSIYHQSQKKIPMAFVETDVYHTVQSDTPMNKNSVHKIATSPDL